MLNYKNGHTATTGHLVITNCYQKIEITSLDSIHKVQLLKGTGPRKIHISFTNLADIDSIYVYQVQHHPSSPTSYNLVSAYKYLELDYYSAYDSIRISPVLKDTVFGGFVPMDVNFVDPIFIVTDKYKPCLPFESFRLNFFSNLNSLCDYKLTLKLPPGTPPPGFPTYNNIGLTPNPGWSMDITDKNSVEDQTIHINSEYCDTSIVPPTPEVNRCFTFDLEIKIFPCNEEDPECPPITYTQPLTFCCYCERFVK